MFVLLLPVLLLTGAGLFAAQSEPDGLAELVDRTGARIEEFWDEYREVTAIEQVRRERRTADGELISENVRRFDYLIEMQLAGGKLRVEESRIDQADPAGDDSDEPYLVTNGFSTLLLIFHPFFRNSFTYTEAAGDERLARVDFTPIRGQRSPAVLRLGGRDYPIEWQGSAWIDRESGMITRIETSLGESMFDLGLFSLSARTDYQSIALGQSGAEYWLPGSTTIEASSEHQHWRNRHEFSDYRLFEVDTGLEIVDAEQVDPRQER